MKMVLVAGVAFGASIGVASAADLTMPVKAPIAPPPYNWTGFYIGINGGYSWGRADMDFTITGVPGGSVSQDLNGWLGGGQIGYNWQSGTWVFGVEADIQGTGQDGTFGFTTATVCPAIAIARLPCATGTGSLEQKLPWFGTVRARLGITPWDRWLIYVTGGLAYGEVETNAGFSSATAFPGGPIIGTVSTAFSSSTTQVGWTVGGGVEWALWESWTAKLEYLYMDLGTVNNSFAAVGPFTTITTSSRITDNIFRGGLNYRFGGPVVARY
jgi:outer membrane immunogenic protein